MTEAERKAASEIVYLEEVRKRREDHKKAMALKTHITACNWVFEYNLPYRVSIDYIDRYGVENVLRYHNNDTVLVNPCYPLPGYLIEKLPIIDPLDDCVRITGGPIENDVTSTEFDIQIIFTEEVQRMIDESAAEQYTWNLSTANGLTQWEYQFAHLLKDYELESFSLFDYFGSSAKDLNTTKKINYWLDLQKRFKENPSQYRQEEPPYLKEYETQYNHFNFRWNTEGV